MPEFLETLEEIQRVEADQAPSQLFNSGDDGQSVSALAQPQSPRYRRALAEAAGFIADIIEGRNGRNLRHFAEAMTTSDFPILFGDTLERQMLGEYRAYPANWGSYAARSVVRDFREVKRRDITGGKARLDRVNEREEYPYRTFEEAEQGWSVHKYGAAVGISWEMLVNDDIDTFARIPGMLADSARNTENLLVTEFFVDANGPHASLYTGGNANIVTGNPALSLAGLQTAMEQLAAKTDSDGNPILIEAVTLVVPPALEITARNILNATELEIQEGAAGDGQVRMRTVNWMRNRVNLVVNPFIPIVASTANGAASWFLFAAPRASQRPAIEVGFLRGHTEPEMRIKAETGRRLGGGAISPAQGSFVNDSVDYRVRYVLGGGVVDEAMTLASNGSGA